MFSCVLSMFVVLEMQFLHITEQLSEVTVCKINYFNI